MSCNGTLLGMSVVIFHYKFFQNHMEDEYGRYTADGISSASSIASSQDHSPGFQGGKPYKKRSTSSSGLNSLGRLFNKKVKRGSQFRVSAEQGIFNSCIAVRVLFYHFSS